MSANTTSPTPYISIGDAGMDSAVLTARDGFDVAWLRRITPSDNIPGHRFQTDDEWQRLINIVDAAPDMLAALERLTHPAASDDDVEFALEVIAKAKGGAL